MSLEIKVGDWVVRKKYKETPSWLALKRKYAEDGVVFPFRFKVQYIGGGNVMFMDFGGTWTLTNFELAPTKKPKKYL